MEYWRPNFLKATMLLCSYTNEYSSLLQYKPLHTGAHPGKMCDKYFYALAIIIKFRAIVKRNHILDTAQYLYIRLNISGMLWNQNYYYYYYYYYYSWTCFPPPSPPIQLQISLCELITQCNAGWATSVVSTYVAAQRKYLTTYFKDIKPERLLRRFLRSSTKLTTQLRRYLNSFVATLAATYATLASNKVSTYIAAQHK